jgi:uncharacterized protein (DUF58 family)
MAIAAYASLLDAVRGVRWPARGPVAAAPPGSHHSRLRGSSAEFAEYRPYRQGDDPRRIDWKLLARSDRAAIRLATERAVLPTTIIIDASASLAFPEDTLGKWLLAKQVAVGLASAAHASADPVGLVVVAADGIHTLAPRTRHGVVGDMMRVLETTAPRGSTPLAGAVQAAHDIARIAIVTDLLGDADPTLTAARVHRAKGGEVHLVHIVAAEELDPPMDARLATDPEDERVERALTESTRDAYLAAFGAWRAGQSDRWTAAGAQYHLASTATSADRIVRQVTDPRRVESSRVDAAGVRA